MSVFGAEDLERMPPLKRPLTMGHRARPNVVAKASLQDVTIVSTLFQYGPANTKDSFHVPLEGSKSCCSLRRATDMSEADPIAQEDCQRNETGEPEDHR